MEATQNSLKSHSLIARIREEADAKESLGKSYIARKSRFVADSLERAFGIGYDIALCDIDKNWLDEYLNYLQKNGKSDNTISNYFRVLLNTFRTAVKTGMVLDLSLFDNYFTGNPKAKKQILTAGVIKKIINTYFDDASVFAHTRDIFSLCFFGGGLSIEQLTKKNNNLLNRLSVTPEARYVRSQYSRADLLSFLGNDYKAAYERNLWGVTLKLGLNAKLNDDSAAEAWAEVAKELNIEPQVIAKVIGRHIDNLNYAADLPVSDSDIDNALKRVARSIGVNTQHWYAIRCYENSPQDTVVDSEKLQDLKSHQIKHFYLEPSSDKKKKKQTSHHNYMKSILFIHCLDVDAVYIRRTMSPSIYVFDYVCGETRKPAPISEEEMKTFMYLSGISSDTIMYYFPDELASIPSYDKYEDVTITQGPFAGRTAKVFKKTANKLNVLVRFEAMNIHYTVEIPRKFLLPTTSA